MLILLSVGCTMIKMFSCILGFSVKVFMNNFENTALKHLEILEHV